LIAKPCPRGTETRDPTLGRLEDELYVGLVEFPRTDFTMPTDSKYVVANGQRRNRKYSATFQRFVASHAERRRKRRDCACALVPDLQVIMKVAPEHAKIRAAP